MSENKLVLDSELAAADCQPPASADKLKAETEPVPEIGGPKGPEPTRYGDWERKGRCVDF